MGKKMNERISKEQYEQILNKLIERNKDGITFETIRNFKGTTQEFCEKYGFTNWKEFDKEMRELMCGSKSPKNKPIK